MERKINLFVEAHLNLLKNFLHFFENFVQRNLPTHLSFFLTFFLVILFSGSLKVFYLQLLLPSNLLFLIFCMFSFLNFFNQVLEINQNLFQLQNLNFYYLFNLWKISEFFLSYLNLFTNFHLVLNMSPLLSYLIHEYRKENS